MPTRGRSPARAIALVGPNGAGKTSLMEALLFAAGALPRAGGVDARTSVGDSSPEARARGQGVEVNVASYEFMGDRYALIDCPGSVDFLADGDRALPAVDLALVVIDSDAHKAGLVQPALKELERLGVPRMLFVNKIDQARGRIRDLLGALQPMSAVPLVARQIPIWDGERVAGFIDLALERAYRYRPGQPSERIDIPGDQVERETEARFHLLEKLADHDDALLEQLLSDVTPELDTVVADLTRETAEALIAPVLFGSAQNGFGVRRLLKALRHDTPTPERAAARVGAEGDCAYVFKTAHAGQAGKLAYARVLSGRIADGADLTASSSEHGRAAGLFSLFGATTKKVPAAETGEVAAIGKVEGARAGDLLSADGKTRTPRAQPAYRPSVYELAIASNDRKDDVRLSTALTKLIEEDPSLVLEHGQESGEVILRGQGEGHLRCAMERLKRRYGVEVKTAKPKTGFRETIRKPVTQRGRHKKQTGGHGQFGDVVIEVRPLQRGEGFQFTDRITGGVVPKQWIPAVEAGVKDALEKGPIGYPVVDVAAVLTDGSYHSVDSSEMAFRTAGRMAMSEALKACQPYLLEPIEKLSIRAPSTSTSRITSAISAKRGQILGFDALEGWPGWDCIQVFLPQSERQDLISELRGLTQGLGAFEAEFDHMAEVTGRQAEEAAKQARAAAA
jgi:elongation factor G